MLFIAGYCAGTVNFNEARDFDNTEAEGENIMQRFKFYLAFENTFCTDYLTEKVMTSLILESNFSFICRRLSKM